MALFHLTTSMNSQRSHNAPIHATASFWWAFANVCNTLNLSRYAGGSYDSNDDTFALNGLVLHVRSLSRVNLATNS